MFESTNTQATNVYWNVVRQTTSSYANGTDAVKLDAGAWSAATGDLDIAVTTTAITSNDKLSQGIQIDTADNAMSVKLWLKKVGSPTGNMTVKIQTNNAGSPSGTTITNGTSNTVAASSLSTSYAVTSRLPLAPHRVCQARRNITSSLRQPIANPTQIT